jgi:hypothetical protein
MVLENKLHLTLRQIIKMLNNSILIQTVFNNNGEN